MLEEQNFEQQEGILRRREFFKKILPQKQSGKFRQPRDERT